MPNYDQIKQIRDFESLVSYLRDELDWPVQEQNFDDLTFEYDPEDLGLDEEASVKIKQIKQLRPLVQGQPWGVFYVDFESKRLPVVVLRKVLRGLVIKKRGGSSAQAAWNLDDLLFISALGEEDHRGISFAHFKDNGNGTPVLQTFSWDDREQHFYYLQNLHMERLRWPHERDPDQWREQWSNAFTTQHRSNIGTSKELSSELAKLAKNTRDMVLDIYRVESKDGPLHQLYKSFQTVLIHDLDVARFADMVAQTIAYGLFSARATGEPVLGLKHLEAMIPNTNPFLKELFAEFTKLAGHGKNHIDFDELGVSKLVDTLNATDMDEVLRDFDRQTGCGQEDPVIHFYESFLREYDREQKVKRGVFYTPKPVVSFIVRSVHKILQDEFGLKYGLADTTTWGQMAARTSRHSGSSSHSVTSCHSSTSRHSERSEESLPIKIPSGVSPESPFVQILDPATGTGTFLVTVIDIIHDTMVEKWRAEGRDSDEIKALWNDYVPKHLLPRVYGFELMMAPYAVAHLKLGLKLKETGYNFASDQRLQVYLTNTLEEPVSFAGQYVKGFLANEAETANNAKQDAPAIVVIGNPPYSISSANKNDFIDRLMEPYKEAVRHEQNIQPLSDDYIKFIRYAHWKTRHLPAVIGMITNHTYLSGLIHRGMRARLLDEFTAIHVVDLHGSTLLGLVSPSGEKDENVFDIQQGVAIIHMVRNPSKATGSTCSIRHSDLWLPREQKNRILASSDVTTIHHSDITAVAPNYFLSPAATGDAEYESFVPVTAFFRTHSTGLETGRDAALISFDAPDLYPIARDLGDLAIPISRITERYGISDTSGWPVSRRRHALLGRRDIINDIQRILYRPFDWRYTIYNDFLRRAQFANLRALLQPNIALIATRMIKGEVPAHIYVTAYPVEKILISPKTSNNAFALCLYQCQPSHASLLNHGPTHNLAPEFHELLSSKIQLSFDETHHDLPTGTVFGPEALFNYIYAVLHSPEYRGRYAEFLKIDFPRIPLTSEVDLFHSLCKLGEGLVGLHLMEKHGPIITMFEGNGDNAVEKVRYTEPGQGSEKGRVWINSTQYFEGVPPEVWEFHIGGYQVCNKWLKDRRSRKLSDEDILHYQRVVAALKETIRMMREIDGVIEAHGGWPLPGSVPEDESNG